MVAVSRVVAVSGATVDAVPGSCDRCCSCNLDVHSSCLCVSVYQLELKEVCCRSESISRT